MTIGKKARETISAIENNRINLGVERAKVLARALNVHPAVLLFPGWRTGAKKRYVVTNAKR